MIEPSVKSVVHDGFNATIFAYGQTGSGKTYTMQGDEKDNLSWEKTGMTQRAVVQIFDELEKKNIQNPLEEEKRESSTDSDGCTSDTDTLIDEVE